MKKKNKKDKQGFTLVELIAVIAIIAIIAVLAILAYGRIQEAMKEKQLEGIHGHIKSVALDFYEDTRLENFNVQMLIDYGLLSTNDNTDQIINPVNNKSMNCFDINFTDEVYSITENYTCKTYNFIYDNIFIINEDGSIFDDSIWYNKNLKLKPKLSDELINSGAEIVSVKWTKKGDSSYINTNEVLDLQVADETVLNDIYSVSVSLNNQNYKASSAYAHVKIDKIKPTITEIERTANCGDGASISAKFEDSDSKVKRYSIRKQNSNKNLDGGVLLTPQEETSATFTLNTAGNYVIEAYDNSGNINSYGDYIDAAPKSQTTSIEVYDSSNKRLSSGSTIKDTYKFKIVVDWKNNDCAKEIKYCVDTTNTCSYNNTA